MYTLALVRLPRLSALLAVCIYRPRVPLFRQVRANSKPLSLANISYRIAYLTQNVEWFAGSSILLMLYHIVNASMVECALPFQVPTRARDNFQRPSGQFTASC